MMSVKIIKERRLWWFGHLKGIAVGQNSGDTVGMQSEGKKSLLDDVGCSMHNKHLTEYAHDREFWKT